MREWYVNTSATFTKGLQCLIMSKKWEYMRILTKIISAASATLGISSKKEGSEMCITKIHS